MGKTYEHGPRINEVAGLVITHLLDYGTVLGAVDHDGDWRPATVQLARRLFPDVDVVTRSDGPGHAAGYTAYFTVMAALDLLEAAEMVTLSREPRGRGEVWRIELA